MALRAAKADVSMLEAAGSIALMYMSLSSMLVHGRSSSGLKTGYAASQ
jgi:hypothetical protein